MPSPVFPLPVIPTMTACVVRSFESYSRGWGVGSRESGSQMRPR